MCLSHQAGDQRWLRTASSALHLLHSLYGPFSKVYGIGRCSKVTAASEDSLVQPECLPAAALTLADLCADGLRVVAGAGAGGRTEDSAGRDREGFPHRQRWEEPVMCGRSCGSRLLPLTHVALFADVDFVSPLCSQVVYEGLVDDIFRIKCGEYQ